MEELELDIYAASTRATVKYRRRLVSTLLAEWSELPEPITHRKVKCLAAGLKAGGYRSASAVLYLFKADAERRGEVISPSLARLFSDVHRSCARGRGPAVAAAPLPLHRLSELRGGPAPWSENGPIGPQNAIVCGAWWMLRELELATARASLLEIRPGCPPVAVLTLPASKNDQEGVGTVRALACICLAGPPRRDCPCHAAWDQKLLLQRAFPSRHRGQVPDNTLPLFPTRSGEPAAKSAVVDMIRDAAHQLSVPAASPDGAFRISGHSLRPTGAQGLARLGVDVLTIQALGRWGSGTVAQYVRGASVSEEAARARANTLGQALAAAATSAPQTADPAQAARDAVRACFPALARKLREVLLADLSAPPACTPDSSSSASSSSSSSSSEDDFAPAPADHPAAEAPAPDFSRTVASRSSKKQLCHKVLVGPQESLDASRWVTMCGWRFGCGTSARHAVESDAFCQKCW